MGTETITINMQDRGRNGGKARAAKMTPAQRSNSARKAAETRWKGHKRKPVKRPLSSSSKASRRKRNGAQGEEKRNDRS